MGLAQSNSNNFYQDLLKMSIRKVIQIIKAHFSNVGILMTL